MSVLGCVFDSLMSCAQVTWRVPVVDKAGRYEKGRIC